MQGQSLGFDVAVLPGMVAKKEKRIYVVVDVIRASSAIVTLFERGCDEVLLPEGNGAIHVDQTTAARVSICAEDVSGRVSSDADFSPSLASILARDLSGHRVYLRTTNGTAAIHALTGKGAEQILVGSLINLYPVMQRAVETAVAAKADIVIVCSGRDGGTTFALDDMYCAGRLVAEGRNIAAAQGIAARLTDSAKAATALAGVHDDPLEAFVDTASAEVLRRAGAEADLALCARENVCSSVPGLIPGPPGLLRLRDLSSSIST